MACLYVFECPVLMYVHIVSNCKRVKHKCLSVHTKSLPVTLRNPVDQKCQKEALKYLSDYYWRCELFKHPSSSHTRAFSSILFNPFPPAAILFLISLLSPYCLFMDFTHLTHQLYFNMCYSIYNFLLKHFSIFFPRK